MEREVAQLGEDVRRSLAAVVHASGGDVDRPMSLIRTLDLDKTLASRAAKVVRIRDPLSALLASPAPTGLKLIADGAAKAKVPVHLVEDLRSVAERFESLIRLFPAGRAGLDAAIGGWLPEGREQRSHQARQQVYKGMSSLLGVTVDAVYLGVWYYPSTDPDFCDGAFIQSQQGIRRLRRGSSLLIGGVRADARGAVEPTRTSLRGGDLGDDPRTALCPELCDEAVRDKIRIVRQTESSFSLTLGPDDPPINTPATIAMGAIWRNIGPRYSSPENRYECTNIRVRKPTALLVADYFIHRDLFVHAPPVPTISVLGLATRQAAAIASPEFDLVDVPLDVLSLGQGAEAFHAAGIERATDIVSYGWRALGQSPADFRTYRVRLEYPVPTAELMLWFELAPRPAS
ncbi:MAG: hypothetical protein SFZ23_07700 [Planctomycetota bacterium]|nr:hypothetical protein [Planctomycetota bacterium]